MNATNSPPRKLATLIVFIVISAAFVRAQNDLYVGLDTPLQYQFTSDTNSYLNIFIGDYGAGALTVENLGTVLSNSASIFVGGGSSGSELIITNGGKVVSTSYAVIGLPEASSNNAVTVTGPDSVWDVGDGSIGSINGMLTVGFFGDMNRLVISNGGTVMNSSYAQIGNMLGSSGNSVTVTGPGSLWSVGPAGSRNSHATLDVGILGNGNSLMISDGGTVFTEWAATIGTSNAASNNSVTVTGAGSLWTVSKLLAIGHGGVGSSLTIAEGGTVNAGEDIYIAGEGLSSGSLNIGRFGANDAAGTVNAPNIVFGLGTGAINFNQSNIATISVAISGAGSVNQLGSGTTILSAANTYSGVTTVSGGMLVVDGSINNSMVTVQSGGTLGGSGSIGGLVVNSGGAINPGNSPGTQTVVGDVIWNGGGNYNWQIFNASGIKGSTNGWDWVNASGSLNLSNLSITNQFNINLWSLSGIAPDTNGSALFFTNTSSYTWTILTASNGITGFSADKFAINIAAFNGAGGFANALGGGTFSMLQSGNDLNLVFTAAAAGVPEPSTWTTAALLVGGAAFVRWRRKRS